MPLCMGCMQEIGDEMICPACGFDNSEKQQAPFLPYGTELAGRYIVGMGVDTNGESTRYLSFDKQTGDIVIVCEFLPMGLFEREQDETLVQVSEENAETYETLKAAFLNYYRVLSELRELSALMDIHHIFEENNTVYVVEDNEDLIPFEEYVKRSNGSLEWDIARPLFMPVISALEAMHKRGIGHYAISPKNMYITAQGKIKISGFATEYERKRGTALKSQLFGGAAAPEQYEDDFPLDDVTDIYGFCATLFYALTGRQPKSAPERLKDSRLLMSTNTVKRLPPHVVSALANGLQIERENRIVDFDELRSQLSVAHTAKAIQDEISRTASMNLPRTAEQKKSDSNMSHVSVTIIATGFEMWQLPVIDDFDPRHHRRVLADAEPAQGNARRRQYDASVHRGNRMDGRHHQELYGHDVRGGGQVRRERQRHPYRPQLCRRIQRRVQGRHRHGAESSGGRACDPAG